MSFKGEVIADSSGKWVGNSLRFATHDEAETYIRGLAYRWTAVRDWIVVESDDPVNSVMKDGKACPLEAAKAS